MFNRKLSIPIDSFLIFFCQMNRAPQERGRKKVIHAVLNHAVQRIQKMYSLLQTRRMRNVMIGVFSVVFLFSVYKIAEYTLSVHETRKAYDEIRALYAASVSNVQKPAGNEAGASAVRPPDAPDAAGLVTAEELQDEDANTVTQDVYVPKTYEIQSKFFALLEENEDIVGWITIDNTHINYPVVQGEDNNEYLHLNIKRRWSFPGSIFMDFRNDIRQEDKNTIIYGHNMNDDTMFSELMLYEDANYEADISTIRFDTLYEDCTWVVFAAYRTTTANNYLITHFSSDEEFMKYVEDAKAKSVYKSDVVVSPDDRILTLSTCSNDADDERFVVHAKLVRS